MTSVLVPRRLHRGGRGEGMNRAMTVRRAEPCLDITAGGVAVDDAAPEDMRGHVLCAGCNLPETGEAVEQSCRCGAPNPLASETAQNKEIGHYMPFGVAIRQLA